MNIAFVSVNRWRHFTGISAAMRANFSEIEMTTQPKYRVILGGMARLVTV